MTLSISTLLNLYQFPPGRIQFAEHLMHEALEGDPFADIRAELRQAIEAGRSWSNLEDHWRKNRGKAVHAPGTVEADVKLDRALSALEQTLSASIQSFGESSPRGRAARHVLDRLFPSGVRQVIHLPYVRQAEKVSDLLWRVEQEPELARAVELTEVRSYLKQVGELNATYRELLSTEKPHSVSFAELRKARADAQETLSRITVRLVAWSVTPGVPDEEVTAIERALDGVWTQNEAIKLHRQRRRTTVVDVDPTTGEEFELSADGEVEEFETDELETPDDQPTATPIDLSDFDADAA